MKPENAMISASIVEVFSKRKIDAPEFAICRSKRNTGTTTSWDREVKPLGVVNEWIIRQHKRQRLCLAVIELKDHVE